MISNIAIPLIGIVDTGLMGNLGQAKFLVATSIAASVMTIISLFRVLVDSNPLLDYRAPSIVSVLALVI